MFLALMTMHPLENVVQGLHCLGDERPLLTMTPSARDGSPSLARLSNTWVAHMTQTCAASQSHNISSCPSAMRSKPHSTTKSPRAIITRNMELSM